MKYDLNQNTVHVMQYGMYFLSAIELMYFTDDKHVNNWTR
jgi:hypothetical protein